MKEFLFHMRFNVFNIQFGKHSVRDGEVEVYVVAESTQEAEKITRRYYKRKFENDNVEKRISEFCSFCNIVSTFIQEPPVALKRNVLTEKYLSKETIKKALNK